MSDRRGFTFIGEMETLMVRIYPLDPETHGGSEVCVEPGFWPTYSDGFSTLWMMTGTLNLGLLRRMGDGAFSLMGADVPSNLFVTFPSRVYGPDEWAALLESDTCTEGPAQRLVFHPKEGQKLSE